MAIGCGGAPATGYCPQGDRNAAQSCFVSTNAAGATTVAATAGALWPIAGGCKVAGCEPPLVCNRDNGFCELPRCDEAQRCPTNLHCNVSTERCER